MEPLGPPDQDRPREVARAESERGEVVLRERPGTPPVLELRVNGVFVMDTVETSTERALATEALALVATPTRVLVAGLGLGFTAREVLADRRVERVAVVELESALVRWLRDGTVPHGPALLADERLLVVEADMAMAVAEGRAASYDLVLLDVDNGPGYLVHEQNAAVYQPPFLSACRDLLGPGGAVVVWSAAESPALADALGAVFARTSARPLSVDLQGRAEEYWLYTGRGTDPS